MTAPTSVFGSTGAGGLIVNAAAAPSRVHSAMMEVNTSTSSRSSMKTAVSASGGFAVGGARKSQTKELDFTSMKNAVVRPGVNPYDSMLPPNYAEMLPQSVQEAFKALMPVGGVPDWVLPLSVR